MPQLVLTFCPFWPNYSNGFSTSFAPDLLAKVAFEPGWGHFEFKALGRFSATVSHQPQRRMAIQTPPKAMALALVR